MRKEFNSQRIFFVHQHGRRFIVLQHQYGRREVMWKRSILVIVKLCLLPRSLAGKQNACKKSRWHSRIMKLLMNVELSYWLLCWPSLFRTTADVIPGDLNKACGVKQDKLCVKTIVYKSKFCANHKLSAPLRPWYWKYNNLANLRLPRSP